MTRAVQSSGFWRAAARLPAIALAAPSIALACPTCKDAVAGNPVGSALSATTLLLIAVPLLLVGSIGGWLSFMYWRAARREKGDEPLFWRKESTS